MSGGYFDYRQHHIDEIIDEIEQLIERNGREKTKEELKEECYPHGWYEQYPEDLYHIDYPEEILKHFKDGLHYLKLAKIYAQRIDWFLSGDDGDESFLIRLKEELETLSKMPQG